MNHQDWDPVIFTKDQPKVKKTQNSHSQKNNKLDNETESFSHKKLDSNFKSTMQRARLACKISQKDLATKLNVKPQVIASYEAGKCVPDNGFIARMERVLKCKLPRASKK